jgi:hypothetical protein
VQPRYDVRDLGLPDVDVAPRIAALEGLRHPDHQLATGRADEADPEVPRHAAPGVHGPPQPRPDLCPRGLDVVVELPAHHGQLHPAAGPVEQRYPDASLQLATILNGFAGRVDTTHQVTNPRVTVDGDTARLTALVEAQHLRSNDHTTRALLKNLYDVELVRDGQRWVMSHVRIDNAWFTGDPTAIFG